MIEFIARRLRSKRTSNLDTSERANPAIETSSSQARAASVYFLHIPKTAGTTIQHIIAAKFGERLCPKTQWDQMWSDNFADLEKYDAFSGHFGMALLHTLGRPAWTFTFLRDPFARTVSHFLEVKRYEAHPYHHYLSDKTFEDFVFDPLLLPMVYNYQARYLGYPFTALACGPRIPQGQSTYGTVSTTWELMSYGMNDDEIRSGALAAIDRLQFIGFVEHMQDSIARLVQKLDLDRLEIPAHNVSKNRDLVGEISGAIRERVADLTRIDKELYDLALARF